VNGQIESHVVTDDSSVHGVVLHINEPDREIFSALFDDGSIGPRQGHRSQRWDAPRHARDGPAVSRRRDRKIVRPTANLGLDARIG
jgi:hypothetical protein